MSRINIIQQEIVGMEGGAFQKLFDEYLKKKYGFPNIVPLGVQTGTNKPIKGVPDSFVYTNKDKYILINYGNVQTKSVKKIEQDIFDCFNKAKVKLEERKIAQIICVYGSKKPKTEQYDRLMHLIEGVEIKLIGVEELSFELLKYPQLIRNHLFISVDTNQLFDIDDFIKSYDASGINAPIGSVFCYRESETSELVSKMNDNDYVILIGKPGTGKTRLAIEACKNFEKNGWKVACVRNNGQNLYEDLNFLFDEPGNYLLFFDDANYVANFDNIVTILSGFGEKIVIKVLITVRDYALDRVIRIVERNSSYEKMILKEMTGEEIREIIKRNVGELNPLYLDRIVEISKGNVRIAMLASIKANEIGVKAIQNVYDIYKFYYGRIMEDAELTKEDIILLFIISFTGPISQQKDGIYSKLKNLLLPSIDEKTILERLSGYELIDWFKNEFVRISDQTFGNYLLYYVFYEKKWFLLVDLIRHFFPLYKNKIVYSINTLANVFASEEIWNYITENVLTAWNEAPDCYEGDYLDSFHNANPIKTLSMIKDYLDVEEIKIDEISYYDIERESNNHRIETRNINLLTEFKNTEYYKEALDLLFAYYDKRRDLAIDIYFAIVDYYLLDCESEGGKYEKEKYALEKLWEFSNEGKDRGFSTLFLCVSKCALNLTPVVFDRRRFDDSISYYNLEVSYNADIASFRKQIWDALCVLKQIDAYSEVVAEILANVRYGLRKEKDIALFLRSDFEEIYKCIEDQKDMTFSDAKLISHFRSIAEAAKMEIDARFYRDSENELFRIYTFLSKHHFKKKSIEFDEKSRRKAIHSEVGEYTLHDYDLFFQKCKLIEGEVDSDDIWNLARGLETVFELVEKNKNKYAKIFELFLKAGAPLRIRGHRQIGYLLSNYGYEYTSSLIEKYMYEDQVKFKGLLWEQLDSNAITNSVAEEYKNFIIDNFNDSGLVDFWARDILRYGKFDPEICSIVIEKMLNEGGIASQFFKGDYTEEEADEVISIFDNRLQDLSTTYISSMSSHVDYDGTLFWKIYNRYDYVWNMYIDWIIEHYRYDFYNADKVIDGMWAKDNNSQYICYAYNALFGRVRPLGFNKASNLLFSVNNKNRDIKKKWLFSELQDSKGDVSKSKLVIRIITEKMPESRDDFVLEFIKVNKSIEDFKTICSVLTPNNCSGSEVPAIIRAKKYFEALEEKIENSIYYLAHRNYLKELCMALEKEKNQVEIKEYLAREDFA